jgi:hypothetical protein
MGRQTFAVDKVGEIAVKHASSTPFDRREDSASHSIILLLEQVSDTRWRAPWSQRHRPARDDGTYSVIKVYTNWPETERKDREHRLRISTKKID